MLPPACGNGSGESVFVIVRSEVACAPAWVVEADALSLPVLSLGVPVIDTWLVNVLGLVLVLAGACTRIVIVAEVLPAARVPRLHVTVPDAWLHVPCDGVAEVNVTPGGSVSVTVTPVAAVLPVWLAVTV